MFFGTARIDMYVASEGFDLAWRMARANRVVAYEWLIE